MVTTTYNQHIASALSNNILDLHILPTEKCNFRCVYCYESFHLGRMNIITINAIKRHLKTRVPELKKLRIAWFGGEPLAATDIVLDISEYAKQLTTDYGCDYNFGMTTNGYLLDIKRFVSLVNAGITSYQISLDGPQNQHDMTRRRADGKGTFDRIWQNLMGIKQLYHDFEIVIRIHVTPENYQYIPELLEKIKYDFHGDGRFKVFLKAIENLGGPTQGTFATLKGQTKKDVMQYLHDLIGKDIPTHSIHKSNLPYICYASAYNAWVIRANGSLAKCTVAFDDDRNAIGKIQPDGTFVIDDQKLQLWLRGLKNGDDGIMGCPAYQLPPLNPSPLRVII